MWTRDDIKWSHKLQINQINNENLTSWPINDAWKSIENTQCCLLTIILPIYRDIYTYVHKYLLKEYETFEQVVGIIAIIYYRIFVS